MLKRTALYDEHVRLGGRLIDFGGWELPVQYSGVIDEHLACRASAGIFDVSHMGEIEVSGRDALAFLNVAATNNVAKLVPGKAQYTIMCNENGGIVDDLVIYCRAQDHFLVVVNASNTDKDFAHFQKLHANRGFKNCRLENSSSKFTQIAIQGRSAAEILQMVTDTPLDPIQTYGLAEGKVAGKIPAILARTGYTGEDGFEIYIPWESGPEIWRLLLDRGASFGIKPCGLGARDTLRLEMKYPLYGHELSDETNPLEAGLGWVVHFEKNDFVGKDALLKTKANGFSRRLVGVQLNERGIPRQGYAIFSPDSGRKIGEVTSGTQSPSLKTAIAIAYLSTDYTKLGSKIAVDIRGTKIPAEVVPTPFYKRPY